MLQKFNFAASTVPLILPAAVSFYFPFYSLITADESPESTLLLLPASRPDGPLCTEAQNPAGGWSSQGPEASLLFVGSELQSYWLWSWVFSSIIA